MATLSSRPAAHNPTAEIRNRETGDLNQGNSSERLFRQGASFSCSGSESVNDVAGSQGITDTQSEDFLTVPLGSLNNCSVTWGSATGSAVDTVSQDDSNHGKRHDDEVQSPGSHKHLQVSGSEGMLATDHSTVDDSANFTNVLENGVQEETLAAFRHKLRPKPSKVSSRVAGTKASAAVATPVVGIYTEDVLSQDKEDDHYSDTLRKPTDQETIPGPATCSSQHMHATVDSDSHNELMIPHCTAILGEVSEIQG
ncbi:hypothetical protein ACP4OV_012794 [Aristida adscensionis]